VEDKPVSLLRVAYSYIDLFEVALCGSTPLDRQAVDGLSVFAR
jgi:hypothetical protein